jgi:hypothetical protein
MANNKKAFSRFYDWHYRFCAVKDYKFSSLYDFYFNDLTLLNEFPKCLDSELTVIEAVGLKETTLYFKKSPSHQFKVKFKYGEFSYDFLSYLYGLHLKGLIVCSKDIIGYFNGTHRYGKWFYNPWIKFDDEGLSLMLKLTYDQYIYKIYKLEQQPIDDETKQLTPD